MKSGHLLFVVNLLISSHATRAEEFRTRPITLTVPLAPGGSVDIDIVSAAAELRESTRSSVSRTQPRIPNPHSPWWTSYAASGGGNP